MNIIDIAILVMGAASIGLIAKNLFMTGELRVPLSVRSGEGLSVKVGNAHMRGYLLVAERAPRGESQERLVELAKSMRISVSFISSMVKVESGKLLRFLDEEIKKAELAYAATKHVRYAERLRVLQELYKRVARDHRSYIGSLSIVLWIPDGIEDGEKLVEAFRSLAEAELGVSLRRVSAKGLPSLFYFPPMEEAIEMRPVVVGEEKILDVSGVIVGKRVNEEEVLIIDWPRDFEAHVGIFGPTGRGKTVLLAGLAAQLGSLSESRLDPYMVVIIDPKGDLRSLLAPFATRVVKIGEGDCVKIPRLTGLAHELVRSSYETAWSGSSAKVCEGSLLERGLVIYDMSSLKSEDRNVVASLLLSSIIIEALERGLPGRVAVVIDEAWRVAQGSANHLIMAIREGRSKGVHVIYATQSPSDVPQIVLDNTRLIAAFGGFTKNYVELARRLGLESAEELLRLPVGEAMIRIGDSPPIRVGVYNYKSMLRGVVEEVESLGVSLQASASGSRGEAEGAH